MRKCFVPIIPFLMVFTVFADVPNGIHYCKTPFTSPGDYAGFPPGAGAIILTLKDEMDDPVPKFFGMLLVEKGRWYKIETEGVAGGQGGLDFDWKDGTACCVSDCTCEYGKQSYISMGNYDKPFTWSFDHQMLLTKQFPTSDEELGLPTCQGSRVRAKEWCWIQVPVIFGAPYGSTVTVTCGRAGASTYPDGDAPPASLSFVVAWPPTTTELTAASICVSGTDHTSTVESMLTWAGLHLMADTDGPTRKFDHDGDGNWTFPNNPQRGMWDTSIRRNYALSPGGVTQLWEVIPPYPPGYCKDYACSPARDGHPDDTWALQTLYDIIICTVVMTQYYGQLQPAIGLGGSNSMVLREQGGLNWDTFLHEYGHRVGLSHVYRNMPNQNSENTQEGYTQNTMYYAGTPYSGWFSSKPMYTENIVNGNPVQGPNQNQTVGW